MHCHADKVVMWFSDTTMQLRDVFVDICHKANLGVRIEAGSALTPDLSRSRPADALVNNWIGGSSAVFDALLAEPRKHQENDPKCDTLGWKCIPLAVESYGNWGFEARKVFSHLTLSVMEIQQCKVKSTFPARIAPFSVPLGRMEAVQGLRKAPFERETWTYFALYIAVSP